MGDLSNKLIRQTFDSLIKTSDEDPIGVTPKRLQDGVGNDLPVEVSLSGMVYYGTQDFTNATVTGISGGGGGTSGTDGTSGVDGAAGTSGTSGTSGGGGGGPVFTYVPTPLFVLEGTVEDVPSSTITLIPANTFQAGDMVEFKMMATRNLGGGGWIYTSVWIGTNSGPGIGDGWNIGQVQSPSGVGESYQKVLYIHTTDGSGDGTSRRVEYRNVDFERQGPYDEGEAIQFSPIPWNTDLYVKTFVWIDNPGSSYAVNGWTLKKIN